MKTMKPSPFLLIPLCIYTATTSQAQIAGVDFESADGTTWERTPDDLDLNDGISVSADWNTFSETTIPAPVEVQDDPNASAEATSGMFAAKLNQGSPLADPPSTAPTDHHFSWSITVPSNVTLNMTDITFDIRQGTGSDTSSRWFIFNTSLDNGPGGDILFSNDSPPIRPGWQNVEVDLSGSTYQEISGTTVTFYFYNETSGSDIDSIVLNGTATTTSTDNTPPSPSPMTWATVPTAVSSNSVTMTATAASDVNGVEYYFTNQTFTDQSHDSGWQDSPTFVDTALISNTTYTYTVKARDKSSEQNETSESPAQMALTEEDTSFIIYNIVSFNNNDTTSGNYWVPDITTITVAPGISGTNDADLLADQTMSVDPTMDTGGGGRFRNAQATHNNVRGTVTTDVSGDGRGDPAGDGYFEFGIEGDINGSISLTTLSFDALRATGGSDPRGYDIDISIDNGDFTDLADGDIANNRNNGLQSFELPLTGAGISSVDFRIRATGGGVEWTNFAIKGGLPTTAPLNLEVTQNGANLDFTWNSKDGKLYNLRGSETLDTNPLTWPIVVADIAGTPPTNSQSVIRPGAPKTFYIVEEFDTPPLLNEDFESGPGGFTVVTPSGTSWANGDPDSFSNGVDISDGAGDSANCWGTNISNPGTYGAGTDTRLLSPVIDLTGVTAAKLFFQEALDFPSGDSAVVNIINDVNDDVIETIYTAADNDLANANWSEVEVSLPATALGQAVRLEFRFTGSGGTTSDYLGWYIDNVLVDFE